MRVLITGGNGLVGRPISEKFVRNGWEVRVIGIEPDCEMAGIRYTQCDILDIEALSEQVEGCDAIVHLAAIPSPVHHPNSVLFNVNVSGTYHVFEAAAKAGVKRIAQASSINALGGYWGCDDRQLDYFPLDENHPLHTTDAYSFSKQMVESIADYYWRRAGITSVSLRLPAVWTNETIRKRGLQQNLATKRERLNAFLQLPRDEQRKRLAEVRQHILQLRARHIMEFESVQSGAFERESRADDWLWSSFFVDRYDYWTFIHSDDSTQAFERAVTADFVGAHPLFVNSDRNYLNVESETLLAVFYPEVRRRSKKLEGAAALVSYDRARQLIGYEARVHGI